MSEIIHRIEKRIATAEEWAKLQEGFPDSVRRLIDAPSNAKRREEQKRLDRLKVQIEDYIQRVYTDLGETGTFLHRHRTAWRQRLASNHRTYIASHEFPEFGLHRLEMHLAFSIHDIQLSGWRVIQHGDGSTCWFAADELKEALQFAAEWVAP